MIKLYCYKFIDNDIVERSKKVKKLINNKKFMLIFGIILTIVILSIVGYLLETFGGTSDNEPKPQTSESVTAQPKTDNDDVASEKTDVPFDTDDNSTAGSDDNSTDSAKNTNKAETSDKKNETAKQPETAYEKVEVNEVEESVNGNEENGNDDEGKGNEATDSLEKKLKKCYVGMTSIELEKVMGEGLKPIEGSAEDGYQYSIGKDKEIVFIFTNRLFDCVLRENGKFTKQIMLG